MHAFAARRQYANLPHPRLETGQHRMMKKPRKQLETSEEPETYEDVVFQSSRVIAGPDDMGFLEISTMSDTFAVVINHDNAEHIIDLLQDFIKGRGPHFERDIN
jgi:hypothetical protein